MEFYEVTDERGRFVKLKVYVEKRSFQTKTHTYSSAYFNALMSEDFESMDKIIKGKTNLEYLLLEK